MNKKILWSIPFLILLTAIVAFLVYTGNYYHADETALSAMESDEDVQTRNVNFGWIFDGPSDENALVFYAGGKVEETAYAPLCHELARNGMDVFLLQLPFRIAFFGLNMAGEVMDQFDYYDQWFIGGHSLGGVAAASYAARKGDDLDGLILLGSYVMDDLDESLKVLLIHGSEDKVLNMDRFEKSLENISPIYVNHVIQGGNHAQFGSYGPQKGDGTALISPEQQVRETVQTIIGTFVK